VEFAPIWQAAKRVVKRINAFQTRLLLVVFYFVIAGPFGLGFRLFGDPLAIKPGSPRGWRPISPNGGEQPSEVLLAMAQKQS
jgi:hypothetical protein